MPSAVLLSICIAMRLIMSSHSQNTLQLTSELKVITITSYTSCKKKKSRNCNFTLVHCTKCSLRQLPSLPPILLSKLTPLSSTTTAKANHNGQWVVGLFELCRAPSGRPVLLPLLNPLLLLPLLFLLCLPFLIRAKGVHRLVRQDL